MAWKILVADDEPLIRDLIRRILESDGRSDVLLAEDGHEAFRLAWEQKPDLIFLDIWLPKIHGWDICSTIKNTLDTRHIKVVMVSGLIQDSVQKRAMSIGSDAFITKPFTPSVIVSTLDKLMGGKK